MSLLKCPWVSLTSCFAFEYTLRAVCAVCLSIMWLSLLVPSTLSVHYMYMKNYFFLVQQAHFSLSGITVFSNVSNLNTCVLIRHACAFRLQAYEMVLQNAGLPRLGKCLNVYS